MVPQAEEEMNENYECKCLVHHHRHQEQEQVHVQVPQEQRKTTIFLISELELGRQEKRREPVQARNRWLVLIFGQFVALVATSMNATSYTLEYGMKKVFPMFLMFFSYVILALHLCWSTSSWSTQSSLSVSDETRYRIPLTNIKLRTPWYYYLCLSILDIGPNYLTLLAMTQTSFTSAILLGSLTIPSTMIFSNHLLKKVFRPMHYVGVLLCMMGGIITLLTDKGVTISSSDTHHPNSYTGDVLAVVAAVGYGAGDAAAEYYSKYLDRKEYLGMIGLFGSLWTLIGSSIYERKAIIELFTADKQIILQTLGVIVWYIISLVAYYVLESLFLTKSDATLLNLSLQTSTLYAVIFSIVAFREIPDIHFYSSIVLVVSGVFVYELCGNNNCQGKRQVEASNDDNTLGQKSSSSPKTTYQSIETINKQVT